MLLRKMLDRKWLSATLLVLFGTALCVRLGIWQLDRLEGRRAFNAQVESMRARPALDLNREGSESLANMEWRAVEVSGIYDFENQVAIRNQYHGDQYGYHLITPLLFPSTSSGQAQTAVLVDRGWIPADGNPARNIGEIQRNERGNPARNIGEIQRNERGNPAPSDWRKYDEVGEVNVSGQIRLGNAKPVFGGVADALPENGARLEIWNNADITRIASQLPYPVLPVYIQPDADAADTAPPIPFQPEIELTEGPHFGYALQWFAFATILFVGYPFYLRKQE